MCGAIAGPLPLADWINLRRAGEVRGACDQQNRIDSCFPKERTLVSGQERNHRHKQFHQSAAFAIAGEDVVGSGHCLVHVMNVL
jgi:hypothetical protein